MFVTARRPAECIYRRFNALGRGQAHRPIHLHGRFELQAPPTNHGPIPELMDRIAAHGSKNHHQRIEHRLRKLELGSTEPRPLRFVFSASSDDVTGTVRLPT
jgi:hypothetical protein